MLNFKNKKVTVMGLGLYQDGSGVAAAKFLIQQGAKVTVTDLKTRKQLNPQINRLGRLAKKIKFVLGRHQQRDFKNIDLIVKNPGVPNNSKYLQIARDHKIPIETDISLFFQLVDNERIIGITGTRGKSTTASLIYKIIKAGNKNAVLAGNSAKSPLAQLAAVKKGGTIILELSSWMLESLGSLKKNPHLAVVTNIYPDHLNTYKNINDYIAAKTNIWRWQNETDLVVLNYDNLPTRKMGRQVLARRFWFSLKKFKEENGAFVQRGAIYFRHQGRKIKVIDLKNIKILGQHNLANILAASAASLAWGVKPNIIKKVVSNFNGIADRLEFLQQKAGIKYYNDTTATTPDATMAALNTLGQGKKIILIAGGPSKNIPGNKYFQLAKLIKKNCKAVVLFSGDGSNQITDKLEKLSFEPLLINVKNMVEAVSLAKSFAKKGDVILLSPASASFGLFINEFDRGNQFKQAVKAV